MTKHFPQASGSVCPPAGPGVTMPCRACDGKGENEYMGLTDTQFSWSECIECEGSGVEAPYCLRCDETLTVDGYCYSCDEYPSGWALAERCALGMPGVVK